MPIGSVITVTVRLGVLNVKDPYFAAAFDVIFHTITISSGCHYH